MKNEKFCFSKGTGLIALVGVLLVGFVLLTQMANTQVSTNSRAGSGCGFWSGKALPFTEGNATYKSVSGCLVQTVNSVDKYQGLKCENDKWKTDFTCSQAYQDAPGSTQTKEDATKECLSLAGQFKSKINKGVAGSDTESTYACSYYTGGLRVLANYMTQNTDAQCMVAIKNTAQCLGYDASVIVKGSTVTPFVTPNAVSQQQYCQTLANQVASLVEYADFNGTKQTTGCTYFKPTGSPRNPANQTGKDNCRVDQTNDSSRCGAVGTALAAAGECKTKRCWNGNVADGVCHSKQACTCVLGTSKTELPKLNVCE